MTGLIIDPAGAAKFSLLNFYIARGARIIPALATLCAILLILGWYALSPVDYVALAGQSGASMTFSSNITGWWRDGNYFSSGSSLNFLLHTWSLSVEWQFYLLYPLFLGALRMAGKRAIFYGVIIALIVSLGASVYFSLSSPTAAFYLLPSRAWEMLIGGVVYLSGSSQQSPGWRTTGTFAGLIAIIASACYFDSESLWPHFFALVPAGGAALVIWCNTKAVLLDNKLAQQMGRASYSIYLWHWPVAVGFRYADIEFSAGAVIAGLVLSVLLGAASYVLVEMPTLSWLKANRSRLARTIASFGPVPAIAAASVVVILLNGVPWRVTADVRSVLAEENNTRYPSEACSDPLVGCDIGTGPTLAVVWGDSMASAVVTAVAPDAAQAGGSVKLFTYGGCPTIFGAVVKRFGAEHLCKNFNETAWATMDRLPATVPIIIINRTSAYIEGFNEMPGGPFVSFPTTDGAGADRKEAFVRHARDTMCRLTKSRRVYFVNPLPEMGFNVPRQLARNLIFKKMVEEATIDKAAYLARNKIALSMAEKFAADCGVAVLDPAPYFCDAEKCYGSKAGHPIFRDDSHPTESGNKVLIPMFRKVFETTARDADARSMSK